MSDHQGNRQRHPRLRMSDYLPKNWRVMSTFSVATVGLALGLAQPSSAEWWRNSKSDKQSQASKSGKGSVSENGFSATIRKLMADARTCADRGDYAKALQLAERAAKISDASAQLLGPSTECSPQETAKFAADIRARYDAYARGRNENPAPTQSAPAQYVQSNQATAFPPTASSGPANPQATRQSLPSTIVHSNTQRSEVALRNDRVPLTDQRTAQVVQRPVMQSAPPAVPPAPTGWTSANPEVASRVTSTPVNNFESAAIPDTVIQRRTESELADYRRLEELARTPDVPPEPVKPVRPAQTIRATERLPASSLEAASLPPLPASEQTAGTPVHSQMPANPVPEPNAYVWTTDDEAAEESVGDSSDSSSSPLEKHSEDDRWLNAKDNDFMPPKQAAQTDVENPMSAEIPSSTNPPIASQEEPTVKPVYQRPRLRLREHAKPSAITMVDDEPKLPELATQSEVASQSPNRNTSSESAVDSSDTAVKSETVAANSPKIRLRERLQLPPADQNKSGSSESVTEKTSNPPPLTVDPWTETEPKPEQKSNLDLPAKTPQRQIATANVKSEIGDWDRTKIRLRERFGFQSFVETPAIEQPLMPSAEAATDSIDVQPDAASSTASGSVKTDDLPTPRIRIRERLALPTTSEGTNGSRSNQSSGESSQESTSPVELLQPITTEKSPTIKLRGRVLQSTFESTHDEPTQNVSPASGKMTTGEKSKRDKSSRDNETSQIPVQAIDSDSQILLTSAEFVTTDSETSASPASKDSVIPVGDWQTVSGDSNASSTPSAKRIPLKPAGKKGRREVVSSETLPIPPAQRFPYERVQELQRRLESAAALNPGFVDGDAEAEPDVPKFALANQPRQHQTAKLNGTSLSQVRPFGDDSSEMQTSPESTASADVWQSEAGKPSTIRIHRNSIAKSGVDQVIYSKKDDQTSSAIVRSSPQVSAGRSDYVGWKVLDNEPQKPATSISADAPIAKSNSTSFPAERPQRQESKPRLGFELIDEPISQQEPRPDRDNEPESTQTTSVEHARFDNTVNEFDDEQPRRSSARTRPNRRPKDQIGETQEEDSNWRPLAPPPPDYKSNDTDWMSNANDHPERPESKATTDSQFSSNPVEQISAKMGVSPESLLTIAIGGGFALLGFGLGMVRTLFRGRRTDA